MGKQTNIRARNISVNPIPPQEAILRTANLATLIIFGRIFFLIQKWRFENDPFQSGAVSMH
jgi:hypothetical protein